MTVALIDGDGIPYIIAWMCREAEVPVSELGDTIRERVDNYIKDLLTMLGTNMYIGAIGNDTNFRKTVYRYQKYKGNRLVDEKVEKVKRIVNYHLINEYKFISIDGLEADDIVCASFEELDRQEVSCIICSPDKDLHQIPGRIYDPQKNILTSVSVKQAHRNLYLQILTGDQTDNIAGIPGMGPVKANKILQRVEPEQYELEVRLAYKNHFGSHYGELIFEQTYQCIKLVDTNHPKYLAYSDALGAIKIQQLRSMLR